VLSYENGVSANRCRGYARGEMKKKFVELNENIPAKPQEEITGPQSIMAEAIEHLQGRQKEVYILHMRLERSLGECAEILGITKSTAQIHKERAVRFIEQYCKLAIKKGRI
jgi:DNA-directed RNA polymerase specialized sigma24 family protein